MADSSGEQQRRAEEDRQRALQDRQREIENAELKDYRDHQMKRWDQKLGLYGLAATALVGLAGTVTTLTVALVQIDNSGDQSKAEFLRDQQITAYSELLTASERFENAQDVIYKQINDCKKDEDASITRLVGYQEWRDALEDLGLKHTVVEIVGWEESTTAAQNLVNEINIIGYSTTLLCDEYGNGVLDDQTTQQNVKNYFTIISDASRAFVDAARGDFNE